MSIGDGLSQCVGGKCTSKAAKSWTTSSRDILKGVGGVKKHEPLAIAIDTRQSLNDTSPPWITLKNLQFGEGTV